ncbi:hypothetical protein ACTXG7_05745 [Mycolicibacterium sp. Dal123E01]|uniref:hypothetical protein n=1 Tax=Mycolicibacterium sp. Dal123E01 TaxID=3457578 RepID=UPI00403E7A2F
MALADDLATAAAAGRDRTLISAADVAGVEAAEALSTTCGGFARRATAARRGAATGPLDVRTGLTAAGTRPAFA